MTDKGLEGASTAAELIAPSVGEVSTAVEGQPPLVPSGITEERVSELMSEALAGFTESQKEILEQLAEREVQSKHDRRYGRFETKLDEILSIKDRVDKADGNWDEILATMERQQYVDTSDAALDAKIEEALTSRQPAPDEAGLIAQRKAEWETEWTRAVQNVQDKATEDKLSIPADAIAQVQSGEYETKIDAYTALNDLYIAVKTGAEIPVAAVQPEGGGETPPASPEETPSEEQYDKAMDNLQTVIRTKGAGSAAAKEAQQALDTIVEKQYEPFR